jgi:hypothetical protein
MFGVKGGRVCVQCSVGVVRVGCVGRPGFWAAWLTPRGVMEAGDM